MSKSPDIWKEVADVANREHAPVFSVEEIIECEEDSPRYSRAESIILSILLKANEPMYGLKIVETSEGKIPRGTVYVTLMRMETKGILRSQPSHTTEGDGPQRILYTVAEPHAQIFRVWVLLSKILRERNLAK